MRPRGRSVETVEGTMPVGIGQWSGEGGFLIPQASGAWLP